MLEHVQILLVAAIGACLGLLIGLAIGFRAGFLALRVAARVITTERRAAAERTDTDIRLAA
jgi:F0F1-type ATP synthase assembly protein I